MQQWVCLLKILHHCLAKRAKLKVLNSLKSNPLVNLVSHILLKLTQYIFLLSCFDLHQNLVIITSNSMLEALGSRKHLIDYVDIAKATILSKISLSPCDSIYSFQYYYFFQTFFLISLKAWAFNLSIIGSKPRQLPYCWKMLIPQSHNVSLKVPGGTFLVNTIEFFVNS